MKTELIPVEGIVVRNRHRAFNAERVAELAKNIKEIGLLQPITVFTPDDQTIELVAGLHRLEAVRSLGWDQVDAVFIAGDEIDCEMAEIAENLLRVDLTKEQRDQHIRRYAVLIEAKEAREANKKTVQVEPFSVVGKGRAGPGRGNKSTAAKVADQTGLSKSTVRRALFKPDPEVERQQMEAARVRREQDRAIEAIAAEEFAHWLLAHSDLDALPTLIAWIEGSKPKDVIDALRRMTSDTPVFDRSAA